MPRLQQRPQRLKLAGGKIQQLGLGAPTKERLADRMLHVHGLGQQTKRLGGFARIQTGDPQISKSVGKNRMPHGELWLGKQSSTNGK